MSQVLEVVQCLIGWCAHFVACWFFRKDYDLTRATLQVDHMITLAKDGSLHARRQALAYVFDKELVHALFEQVRTAAC